MTKVVSVRFRGMGKIYYFDPVNLPIEAGMHVIVETARGVEYGMVIAGIREVDDEKVPQPFKPVIRIATPDDDERARVNREKEKEALALCKEKILKHELEMKLIDAEYTFDNNKILFYFTADGRVDFRELVKDLAGVFRTRIELRQIGVRDETKILGGIGICGRALCCHSYLTDFIPVSIRMAKEQNLSLNPTKISGVCGRLMCCLKNEEATYEYLNGRMPVVGESVMDHSGLTGTVSEINVLRQKVKVLVENDGEKEIREYNVEELKFRPRRRRDNAEHPAQGADTPEEPVKMQSEHPVKEKKEEHGRERRQERNREHREGRGQERREDRRGGREGRRTFEETRETKEIRETKKNGKSAQRGRTPR